MLQYIDDCKEAWTYTNIVYLPIYNLMDLNSPVIELLRIHAIKHPSGLNTVVYAKLGYLWILSFFYLWHCSIIIKILEE